MIIPKRDTVRRTRARKGFTDAMGASIGLEEYILGDASGRINDPVDSSRYLVRRDENAPVESFPYAALGPVPTTPGTVVLVGWHFDGRKVIGVSTSAMQSGGRNAAILNSADARIYGYWSKEGYGDLKCMALGTTANPSTKYAINARSWITDEYEAVGFQGIEGDVVSHIPGGTDQHRLAVVVLKEDLTTTVLVSTAVSVLTPINASIAYLQECIDALPPRAIPVQVFRLYSGQTSLTEADKVRGGDLRDLINSVPPRMNWNAITDPDVDDDNSIGYGVGSKWINGMTPSVWVCVDDSEGAAVWLDVSGGSSGAPADAKYILQQADGDLPNAQALSSLATGDMQNTTSTGVITVLKSNRAATTAPTASDDNTAGYAVGSRWINLNTDTEYVCTDASTGAALWRALVSETAPQTLASKILSQLVLILGGFKATFSHAFTADHTVTIPGDADVTLVGVATTQTLTGKTLDGDDNTVQDLPLTAIKTVGANTNRLITRDASGVPQDIAKPLITGGLKLDELDDTNGNEIIKLATTASAVNEFTVTNAATGNAPELSASGGDTNIGIKITPKGTGQTSFANAINFIIGTFKGILTHANTADRTYTLPNHDGTISTYAAGEINALTEKTAPVSADLIMIEDSAASNARKKVQLGNLKQAVTLLAYSNPGSNQTSIVFNITPTTGTLIIEFMVSSSYTAGFDAFTVQFNGDTANHDYHNSYASGTAIAAVSTATNGGFAYAGLIKNVTGSVDQRWLIGRLTIWNVLGTSKPKEFESMGRFWDNGMGVTNTFTKGSYVGSSAISSLTFANANGNILADSWIKILQVADS